MAIPATPPVGRRAASQGRQALRRRRLRLALATAAGVHLCSPLSFALGRRWAHRQAAPAAGRPYPSAQAAAKWQQQRRAVGPKGGLADVSPGPDASRQPKSPRPFVAVPLAQTTTLLTEQAHGPVAQAARYLSAGLQVFAGLVALLYATSWFEAVSHGTAGLLSGSSPRMAGIVGLAVGCLHTVSGPDHLAGIAPLVAGQRRSPLAAFGLGALWGSGHATGQLLIGMACLSVHMGMLRLGWMGAALEHASGFLVGASLVGIGILGLQESRAFDLGARAASEGARSSGSQRRRFGWATYATGVLHGLSPDAIIFIMPALALPRIAAVSHVFGVVLGTLLAMGGCAAALGAVCRSPRLSSVSAGASWVAVALGACVLAGTAGLSVPLPGL